MKALKLLTGLVPVTGSVSGLISELNVSGSGGGTLFETDFFLRRKNAEDFLVTTGIFSLFAEASVDVRRTGFGIFPGGVVGCWLSSCTGVVRPWGSFVRVFGVASGWAVGFLEDPKTRRKNPGRGAATGSWRDPRVARCSRATLPKLGTLFMDGSCGTDSLFVLIVLVPNAAVRLFFTYALFEDLVLFFRTNGDGEGFATVTL